MTTIFGRLHSDIGHLTGLPEYSPPLIDKAPPQSMWSKRIKARTKYAIDANEEMMFKQENVDTIKDRIIADAIRKVPYGQNRGSAMSYSAMMNPTLLGNNTFLSTHAENPRKAFRYGYYRPNIKNSFDVYRPIGKAPDRGIVVGGKVSRNTTVTSDMLGVPEQKTQKIQKLGSTAYWDSVRTAVQPTSVFNSVLEPYAPKLKDMPRVTNVVANSSVKIIGNSSDNGIPFTFNTRESNPITVSANPTTNIVETVIPFIPDYIIREVEPITISSNPITNIVDFVDVIDMTNGRKTELRKTLPKILGSRYQIKVYDTDTNNYVKVHDKDIPQIMAQSNQGNSITVPVEGTDKPVKLRNFRMIAYTANNRIPMLVFEPWIMPKTKEQAHIQVSSNIGTSYAETTDLFVPSFREKEQAHIQLSSNVGANHTEGTTDLFVPSVRGKNSIQISQGSEAVFPKQQNLGLSAPVRTPAVPVGRRGAYHDRVSMPSGEVVDRPTAPYHQRNVNYGNPLHSSKVFFIIDKENDIKGINESIRAVFDRNRLLKIICFVLFNESIRAVFDRNRLLKIICFVLFNESIRAVFDRNRLLKIICFVLFNESIRAVFDRNRLLKIICFVLSKK